jgi:hypothetical protein
MSQNRNNNSRLRSKRDGTNTSISFDNSIRIVNESVGILQESSNAELVKLSDNNAPTFRVGDKDTSQSGGTYIDYFLPVFDTFIFHNLKDRVDINGTGSEYYQGVTGRATGEDRWYALPTPGTAGGVSWGWGHPNAFTGAGWGYGAWADGNMAGRFAITGGDIPKTAHSLPIGLINMWSDYNEDTPNLAGITVAPRTPTRSIIAFDVSSLGKTYSIGPTKLYLTLEDDNNWDTSGG